MKITNKVIKRDKINLLRDHKFSKKDRSMKYIKCFGVSYFLQKQENT